MAALKMLTLAACIALTACSSAAQRRAADDAAIQRQAAQEVRRICALPEPERQAQIDRTRVESGMAIVCPHPRNP